MAYRANKPRGTTLSLKTKNKSIEKKKNFTRKTTSQRSRRILNEMPTIPSVPGTVFIWGNGDLGQLGLGSRYMTREKPYPLNALTERKPVDVIAGSIHNIVLTVTDGGPYTWGCNDHGALGRPSNSIEHPEEEDERDDHIPCVIPGLTDVDIVMAAAADNASMVLTSEGRVYGWGTFRGPDGVLGFSPEVRIQTTPVLIEWLGAKKVVAIACGADHVLALTDNGEVWSWGNGTNMQLGRRPGDPRLRRAKNFLYPERVPGLRNIKMIGCGWYHSMAVDDRNRLWTWGANNMFQCGIQHVEAIVPTPIHVTTMDGKGRIIKVDGGEHHTIVLMDTGDIYTFGRGDSGELGIPPDVLYAQAVADDPFNETSSKKGVFTPILVEKTWEGKIIDIVAGGHHNLALTEQGQLWAWGFGSSGQLANATGSDEFTPVRVLGQKLNENHVITRIGAGAQHSICLANLANKKE